MLKVENISTGYGKKQVLFDVSFEVKQSEIVLLAGSNGSGKSTLLKAIYGMLTQWNNGQIIFDGEDITGKPVVELLHKGLLYIPQKNSLFEDLTVMENLEMAGLTINQDLLKERIEEVFLVFKALSPHLARIPMKLSGGERQLLTLAMAALHQPRMILIDEPFSGLSPKNITLVSEYLRQLNVKNEITFLIVEHRVKECLKIANTVIGLKLGRILHRVEVNSTFDINELNSVFV